MQRRVQASKQARGIPKPGVSSVRRFPWRGSNVTCTGDAVLKITSAAVALAEAFSLASIKIVHAVMAFVTDLARAMPLKAEVFP